MASQFFLSLEDDLMRLFGGMERIANAMDKMGAEEGEVITHALVTRSIGRAQKRVEGNNFEARKRLLDYDDVMNQQREVIYDLRLFALEGGEDLKGEIWEMIHHTMEGVFADHIPESELEEGIEVGGLRQRMLLDLHTVLPAVENEDDPEEVDRAEVLGVAESAVREAFERKIESFGEHGERVMSFVLLSTIDGKWKDHLYDLDHLKASIGFRGWGQKDPLGRVQEGGLRDVRGPHGRPAPERDPAVLPGAAGAASGHATAAAAASLVFRAGRHAGWWSAGSGSAGSARGRRTPAGRRDGGRGGCATSSGRGVRGDGPMGAATDVSRLATNRGEARQKVPVTATKAPGRNAPCPCGSGRKYKKCCGRVA